MVEIAEVCGRRAADDVIGRSLADYRESHRDLASMLAETLPEPAA